MPRCARPDWVRLSFLGGVCWFVILILILILIDMNPCFDPEKLDDVLAAKGRCEAAVINLGKERLLGIVLILVGLIRGNSDYCLHEGH